MYNVEVKRNQTQSFSHRILVISEALADVLKSVCWGDLGALGGESFKLVLGFIYIHQVNSSIMLQECR